MTIEELTTEIMKHWQARPIGPSTVCLFCEAFVPRGNEPPGRMPHKSDCIVRKILVEALVRNVAQ